jgi:hypothetical protein
MLTMDKAKIKLRLLQASALPDPEPWANLPDSFVLEQMEAHLKDFRAMCWKSIRTYDPGGIEDQKETLEACHREFCGLLDDFRDSLE